jgi:hypothetical protein
MKFDVIGRINNMRLPDGKTATLYTVYEAVSNSIHAINDRFSEKNAASKGEVHVDISRACGEATSGFTDGQCSSQI